MRKYKHLTFTDRLRIDLMIRNGMKPCAIAKELGVTHATIYTELKRGRYDHMKTNLTIENRYSPDIAQAKYEANLKAKGPGLKIGKDIALAQHIENKIISEKYSPAAVLGEIKARNIKFSVSICVGTLYSYIEKGLFLHLTNKDLPVKGTKKRKYRKVRIIRPPRGESIERRELDGRNEFGHWEMDTVMGRRKKGKALLVLTERKTRQEIIALLPQKTSSCVVAALDNVERRMDGLFPRIFKSITVDNGAEFADCDGIERSINTGRRTKLYYCHPYSSWERGSNENQNKLIRRFFPKGKDLNRVTRKQVKIAEEWLNAYPRRIFGYKSARDLWEKEIMLIV